MLICILRKNSRRNLVPLIKIICNKTTDYVSGSQSLFQLIDSSGNFITGQQEGLLLHNKGTVCDDQFNMTTAGAICRVMGFEGVVDWRSAGSSAWQIQNTFSITTDDIICPLPDWSSCTYILSHNCAHHEDVFLTCAGSCSPFSLVDRTGFTVSGNREFLLLFNGGTVCSDQFTNQSADAICRNMGYSRADSWRADLAWNSAAYRIALDDVNCTEGHWSSCTHTTSHNCIHGKDIFISCKSNEIVIIDKSKSLKYMSKSKDELSSKEIKEKIKGNASYAKSLTEERDGNVAIAILIIMCITLVGFLVKKNSQIDKKDLQIDKKDLQIDEFLKKTDKLLESIDKLEDIILNAKSK